MVNISKVDDSTIKFTFTDNDRYLYNGEISLPLNSLILELDASDMVIFKKIDGDVFVTFLISNSNFDTKEDLEEFYATSMVGSTGGGGDITSGEVQTMIDESISGKADTSAVTESINAAVSGKQDTLSAGTGIEIDSANTITAIYEGYPYVDEDDEYRNLTDVADPFYLKHDDAGCQGSSNGTASFYCDNDQYYINFDFTNHNITYDTEDWRAYFSITWDEEVTMFLVTPLQTISSVNDEMCTRLVWPTDIILTGSGKTTSVITDVMRKADASVNNLWFNTNRDNLGIYYVKNGSDTVKGTTLNIGGGLYGNSSNNTLTTRVIKSLDKIWADYPEYWEGRWYADFDNVEAVSFDLTATPTVSITVSTTNHSMETIVHYDGSIATGQLGVTVTEDNGHIVVTAIDGLITNLGAQTLMGNYMANLKQYGYEYTTVDDAIETILSGKQDTLSAGTGIEISGNVISATGGGGGIDSGTVQTMIDESISGKADTSAVTESINAAVSGKADISDIPDVSNYFDGAEYDSGTTRINFYHGNTVKAYIDASAFIVDGMIDDVRIETISDVTYLVIDFNTASGKEDIQIPITDIFDASNYYSKSEIDSIESGLNDSINEKLDASAYTPTDLSEYWTSAQTETAISNATSGKADTSAVTESINAAVSGKQDTLSAGTGIEISDNVISATGGGTTYSAGTNISISTANTISCTLPITVSEGFNNNKNINVNQGGTITSGGKSFAVGYLNKIGNKFYSIALGTSNILTASSNSTEAVVAIGVYNIISGDSDTSHSVACGYGNHISGGTNPSGIITYDGSKTRFACGTGNEALNGSQFIGGFSNKALNFGEFGSGTYNNSVSASTTFGDSGNTLFSVGNGTSNSNRHNAFEIRQNGDIYCSDGTNDVKLQDTITATAANTSALGGLKLVKLTQAQYDALSPNYDNNTLYVIKD